MIHFLTTKKSTPEKYQAAKVAWEQLISRQDLGFIQLPLRNESWQSAIRFANQIKEKSKHMIVVGMGGSALGGKCLIDALGDSSCVLFLYNTDPDAVEKVLSNASYLDHSHFLFISKSGGTLELACIIDVLQSKLKSRGRKLSDAISVITEDKPSALYNWAKEHALATLAHPMDVGGRFSVFTAVGVVPAVFSGVSAEELQKGTQLGLTQRELVSSLAAFYVDSFTRGESISAFWLYVDQMAAFMPWLMQLWAESLAKKTNRDGQQAVSVSTPIAYFGSTDQHSMLQQLMEGAKDKSVCFIRCRKHSHKGHTLSGVGLPGFEYLRDKKIGQIFQAQSFSTEEALNITGQTTLSLELDEISPTTLAELMVVFELLIGVIGELININAFDQPGVELGKKLTIDKLK